MELAKNLKDVVLAISVGITFGLLFQISILSIRVSNLSNRLEAIASQLNQSTDLSRSLNAK